VERISAVDGQTLSQDEIESIADVETYRKNFKMRPEAGTIGCSLSHERTWKKFLESDDEFALIFEDDVQFDPKELLETVKLVVEKESLWDVANFETKHGGCPLTICELAEQKRLVFYLTNVTHAGCYLINRKAAEELLKKFYPIKMPNDHYFTAAWEFGLKFVGIEPRIVFQKFGDSQIKTSPDKKIKTLDVLTSNAIHNVGRAVIHFAYNLFCFVRAKTTRN
jgi:GR25 family glycosyltransferase involved in LPS biosynthesis